MNLKHDGITQSVEEWAADYGIPCKTIRSRLKRGWSVERSITEPMPVWRGEKLKIDDLQDAEHAPAHPVKLDVTPVVYQPPRRFRSTMRRPRCQKRAQLYTFNSQTLSLTEWATKLGVGRTALLHRLSSGWSIERTFSVPPRRNLNGQTVRGRGARVIEFNGRALPVKEWAHHLGVAESTLNGRLNSPDWTLERALTTGNAGTRRRGCRPHPGGGSVSKASG